MKPRIVAFVGLPFTGKSTAREITEQLLTAKKRQWQKVYFGGITVNKVAARDKANNWPAELTNGTAAQKEKWVRETLRAEQGLGVIAILCLPEIDQAIGAGKVVLIDDLYSEEERIVIVEKYGYECLTLVALAADWPNRVRRAANRLERKLTEPELADRDEAEIMNLNKAEPIARAHFTIVNNANELENPDTAKDELRRELENRVLPAIL